MLKFDFSYNLVPPDRLRYKTPDGHMIEASDRRVWYSKIQKHYADNGIPLPDNIEEVAQDQLCRVLPPGWCKHENGEGYAGIDTRLHVGDIFRGMEVLSTIALSADPLVSQDLAEQRARKCAACPANVPVAGCLPCMKIPDIILGIKGAKTTTADPFLKSCACCKCSTAAKVWVKAEILATVDDATIRAQMRSMPDCWAVQEMDKLDNQPS